ncbi:MAG TPA: protein-glutamate O-methyltransferase CheR [Sphingobacteriaceae bacterium]|nr:protein-glutamate O-methyltransferase CheR [Sphingobacteriaceae bacterium]
MSRPDDGYQMLAQRVRRLTGLDLRHYRQQQLQRRLKAYLDRHGLPDYGSLARRITNDSQALRDFMDYLTINVTEFFRDGRPFDMLVRDVLPSLLAEFRRLKVWSAGCASGAETYSLAILLEELDPGGGHQVLGTDVDGTILKLAQEGVYDEHALRGVSPERRRKFFEEVAPGMWRVLPELRRKVRFVRHDLLADPYPEEQHLILCRNVVIYFTEEAKSRVHRQLAESLVPGGYLLVGATETLLMPGPLGLEIAGPFLYRRTAPQPAAVE